MANEENKAAEVNAAKLKALQATIDKIEKDYGKGTIMKLGEQPDWDVQVIPSGSVALDHAPSAAIRAEGSLKSTAPSPAARRRSRSTRLPRPRSSAASRR